MLICFVSLFISTSQWVIPHNIETNNVIKLPFYTRFVICSYEIRIKFLMILFRKRITKINKILLFHAAIRWKEHNKLDIFIQNAKVVIMNTDGSAKCVRIHHMVRIVSLFVIAKMNRVTTKLDVKSRYLMKVRFLVGSGEICVLNEK